MKCKRCSAKITLEDFWCPSCGIWISAVRALCECDPALEAIGACVVCGLPVCGTCSRDESGTVFCLDSSHRIIHGTHVRLASFGSMFEAEWVGKNLSLAGIDARVFAWRSFPGYYGMELTAEGAVFVLSGQEQKAAELLRAYSDPVQP